MSRFNKTSKNKITIYGGANIEQILSIIGFHLMDLSKTHNIKSFEEISFYFKSNNGKNDITFVDAGNEIIEWKYKLGKKEKNICIDNNEIISEADKPIHEVNFTQIFNNILKMFERNEEIINAKKQEQEKKRIILEQKKARDLEKLNYFKIQMERKARRDAEIDKIVNQHLTTYPKESPHKLKKWNLSSRETALEKYLGVDFKGEIKLPLAIIKDGNKTYIYDSKSELLKINNKEV